VRRITLSRLGPRLSGNVGNLLQPRDDGFAPSCGLMLRRRAGARVPREPARQYHDALRREQLSLASAGSRGTRAPARRRKHQAQLGSKTVVARLEKISDVARTSAAPSRDKVDPPHVVVSLELLRDYPCFQDWELGGDHASFRRQICNSRRCSLWLTPPANAGPASDLIAKLNTVFVDVMQNAKSLGYEGRYKKLEPTFGGDYDFTKWRA